MEGLFSFSYVVMLHSRLQGAKVFHFVKTKTLSNVLCRLKKIDEAVSFGLKQQNLSNDILSYRNKQVKKGHMLEFKKTLKC